MVRNAGSLIALGAVTVLVIALGSLGLSAAQAPAGNFLAVESALLTGLAPGAVFPFIDSTPRAISRAHIAVTDAAKECKAGGAAPTNIQVLVGQAGGALAPVMTAATNTGISTARGQCVFHITVSPNAGGVPATITDVVVRNAGKSALTGVNTVTVSAEIR